jgi:tRNA(Ile)-lysidine synthase
MTELQAFEARLAAAWPVAAWQAHRLIVAVSGGADSVALVRALSALHPQGPGKLVVAHFNHRLRGADSDADAQFVCQLAERLGLAFQLGQAAPLDKAGQGWEAAARQVRYEFLEGTARGLGARYVVTAHTADDQAETILHHVLRGTGLLGLAGMQRVRQLDEGLALLRPMLDLRRSDVVDYLTAIDQPYCQDVSNWDRSFTRNRIRHDLMPLIEREIVPKPVESLLRLGRLAADSQRVIGRLVDALAERVVVASSSTVLSIDCRPLASEDPHLVRELMLGLWRGQRWPLVNMGYAQWETLAGLARASGVDGALPPAVTLPGAIIAARQGDRLVLTRPAS